MPMQKLHIPTKSHLTGFDGEVGTRTQGRIVGKCRCCGKEYETRGLVTRAQITGWYRGTLIQIAMPGLTKDDREFLISGYCPDGWKRLFS